MDGLGLAGSVRLFCQRLRQYDAGRRGRKTPGVDGDTIAIPEGLDWFVWRPVFSEHCGHVSKQEIDEHWSLVELLECHELIDLHEELERRSMARMKARAASKR